MYLACLYLSWDFGSGPSEWISIATSLFTVLDHITSVRLELSLFDGVQFEVTSMLFLFFITLLTLLGTLFLLQQRHWPTQPSIPTELVSEDQLWLRRQRRVWFMDKCVDD